MGGDGKDEFKMIIGKNIQTPSVNSHIEDTLKHAKKLTGTTTVGKRNCREEAMSQKVGHVRKKTCGREKRAVRRDGGEAW